MNFNTQQAMINTKDTQKKMMTQIYTKYQVVIRSSPKTLEVTTMTNVMNMTTHVCIKSNNIVLLV